MNTKYWVNKIMDTMYTSSSSQFWIGLSSTEPTRDGTGITEPSGNNYSRVRVTQFTSPENGTVKNVNAITFNRSTGVWFDADHKAKYWVLFDGSSSSAHLLSSGELDEAKTIESNTTITVAANTLSVTLTDYYPSV